MKIAYLQDNGVWGIFSPDGVTVVLPDGKTRGPTPKEERMAQQFHVGWDSLEPGLAALGVREVRFIIESKSS